MRETSSLVCVPPYRTQYGQTATAGTGNGLMGFVPGQCQTFFGEIVLYRQRWVLVHTPAGVDTSTIPQLCLCFIQTRLLVWGDARRVQGPGLPGGGALLAWVVCFGFVGDGGEKRQLMAFTTSHPPTLPSTTPPLPPPPLHSILELVLRAFVHDSVGVCVGQWKPTRRLREGHTDHRWCPTVTHFLLLTPDLESPSRAGHGRAVGGVGKSRTKKLTFSGRRPEAQAPGAPAGGFEPWRCPIPPVMAVNANRDGCESHRTEPSAAHSHRSPLATLARPMFGRRAAPRGWVGGGRTR